MKSKIIKVSIILIFMMFSTCLFNFCFAFNVNITKTHDFVMDDKNTYTAYFGQISDLPEITETNLVDTSSSFNYTSLDYYNFYNNNGYIIRYFPLVDKLYLYIPTTVAKGIIPFTASVSPNLFCFTLNLNDVTIYNNTIQFYCFVYNTDARVWEIDSVLLDSFAFSENSIFLSSSYGMYGYTDTELNSFSLVCEAYNGIVIPPTDEELISTCDFKVNFKFNPKNSDYPVNVDNHWYVYETALITHSMSNWENYNINMSISLNKDSSARNNDTYFELYDISGKKLIEKTKLVYGTSISSSLSEDDFYILLTDNINDVVKVNYDIYNFNNELLLKKQYVIKFAYGGFGSVDFTGTVIEENTYDSNGTLIESGNTSFETNGNDETNYTNNNYQFDSLYKLDKNTLQANATDLINGSSEFFGLVSLFLFMLPSWISSLLYLFFFGIIIITLLRFIRGA